MTTPICDYCPRLAYHYASNQFSVRDGTKVLVCSLHLPELERVVVEKGYGTRLPVYQIDHWYGKYLSESGV